jgi:transposase
MVYVMPKSRPPYPEEFRREAVHMVRSGRTVSEVAESLGVTEQSLRNSVKQDQLDRRERDDGLRSEEREELGRLRREIVVAVLPRLLPARGRERKRTSRYLGGNRGLLGGYVALRHVRRDRAHPRWEALAHLAHAAQPQPASSWRSMLASLPAT